jgi:hypothetical protein
MPITETSTQGSAKLPGCISESKADLMISG